MHFVGGARSSGVSAVATQARISVASRSPRDGLDLVVALEPADDGRRQPGKDEDADDHVAEDAEIERAAGAPETIAPGRGNRSPFARG
jgi:hypothetical protein